MINLENIKVYSYQSKRQILLGAGGVGNNFRNIFIKKPIAYDPDIIELHNLNRCLFGITSIKSYKGSNIHKITNENYRNLLYKVDKHLVIDARDTMNESDMFPEIWIKLAYDGGSNISFTFHPYIVSKYTMHLNMTENAYAVQPSFYVPSKVLAFMTCRIMQYKQLLSIAKEKAGTILFNIDDVINNISYKWDNTDE
jgi:hypothetical protein